jgi:GT2 family glycosyltransferase
VETFSTKHDFVQLLNVTRTGGHNFGKKVLAFNCGLEAVRDLKYDFVGNLDADITVGENYFESVLRAFQANPRLGIAGGAVFSNTQGKFVNQNASLDSVAGAVQLFRRECFEEIGGIPLLEHGGEDGSAEIKARMKGWKVEQLPNLHAHEHRRTGTARSGLWLSKFREGRRFYSMGYGVGFYGMRCVYRSKEAPMILGSMMAFAGYLRSAFQREPKAVSPDLERFLKTEQRSKLKRLVRQTFSIESKT